MATISFSRLLPALSLANHIVAIVLYTGGITQQLPNDAIYLNQASWNDNTLALSQMKEAEPQRVKEKPLPVPQFGTFIPIILIWE